MWYRCVRRERNKGCGEITPLSSFETFAGIVGCFREDIDCEVDREHHVRAFSPLIESTILGHFMFTKALTHMGLQFTHYISY